MIKEVNSKASVHYTYILNVMFQLKNQPPQQGWMRSRSDTSPRPRLMRDVSPLTSAPSLQPGSSSSSETYIDVPPRIPYGLTEHDLCALFNPSLQQDLPKPDVLAQLIDRLASADRVGLGHCGCANETNSYIVLLELSLRLRKTSEVVGHHFKHFSGSTCALNQRIIELDRFISCVKFRIIKPGFVAYGSRRHVLAACNPPPGFYLSPVSPQHHHTLPHATHSHSTPHSVSHSVTHSPITGTPMPITPTGHNYSQPPMRPTLTLIGSFAMQSQMVTGSSMLYPSPPCDEPMSQLERQPQTEWHHPVQGQGHSMQVT